VRHPENASALSEKGVTLRACDYENAAKLAEAFEPGDRVLLISSNDFVNSVAQHAAVVQAARASEVSLLVYTSLLNAGESRLIVAQPHRATEPIIRESGIPYTLLRNNLYSEHFAPFILRALNTGTFDSCTRDGRVASASRRDFSAAAAAVLTQPGHEGKTYELSGDVAWSNSDLVEALSAISHTDATLRTLTDRPPPALAETLNDVLRVASPHEV
jgi:NAD(P)H dehydrogenase (quinone)